MTFYSLGVYLLEIFLLTSFTVGLPPPKLSFYDSDVAGGNISQELESPAGMLALFEAKVVELGVNTSQL